eukprot:2602324-Amphidinium_carterae.1
MRKQSAWQGFTRGISVMKVPQCACASIRCAGNGQIKTARCFLSLVAKARANRVVNANHQGQA